MKTNTNMIPQPFKRIGNIGVLPVAHPDYKYDIVLYVPNCYYGKKSEYEPSSTPGFLQSLTDPHYRVQEECFDHPETHVSIAYVTDSDSPDILTVGIRPWELEDKDKSDFEKIVRWCVREDAVDD